jgi:hypothetical protein
MQKSSPNGIKKRKNYEANKAKLIVSLQGHKDTPIGTTSETKNETDLETHTLNG